MPAENVLEVHHLSKHVGQGEHQLTILTGVELLVKPAQTIALIGESGSGKSTLLGILAGLDDGSEGEVRLLGESLTALDEEGRAAARQERRLRISVVHAGADAERAGKRAAAGAAARRERQAEPRAGGAAAGTAGIGQTARSPAGAAVRRRAAVWRWRAPSAAGRGCCSPMNRPATSIARPAIASPICCFPQPRF